MQKELVRSDLHKTLKEGFKVNNIHSEYGMTELLSQAYSKGDGHFYCPPWMNVITRSLEDPFEILDSNKTGAINVIDLANLDSCAFIATQDLGRTHKDGSFEVLGRFDQAEIRGCNLMVV
jgi:non-ribosomal peptide synthetase component F